MAGKTISEMVGKPLEMGGYQIIPENGARKTKDYKMEIWNGKRFLQKGGRENVKLREEGGVRGTEKERGGGVQEKRNKP